MTLSDLQRTALLAGGLVGAVLWFAHTQRQAGANAAREEAASAAVKPLVHLVKVADTVRLAARVRFVEGLAHWDTVRTTDTLTATIHDTAVVYVPRAEADTVLAICSRALSACELSIAARDSLIRGLNTQVKALIRAKPGFFAKWTDRAISAGVGAGILAIFRR